MEYKPTILYVEDELNIRKQLSKFLTYISSELYIAQNGEDGLEQYKLHSPDIVVSDIKMPKMNGIDMVKAIKAINLKQHVIFTTAHSESGFFLDAIEVQVDGYILKPVELDLLENKIEQIKEQILTKRKLKAQIAISTEIAKLQHNLLMVVNENHTPIFANDKFLHFFDIHDTVEFIHKYQCLDKLFIESEDSFISNPTQKDRWTEQISSLPLDKRLVTIKNNNTNKNEVFLLSMSLIEETNHNIITLTEITVFNEEKKLFQEKAYIDELTSIANRAYFDNEFAREISRHLREASPLSFIILDIDKFKDFNDKHGHLIGDEILKELAKIIDEKTRETDIFARWGGEEFVSVLPNTSLYDAKLVAENLRQMIEEHTFINNLKVTCSFGVAQFQANDDKNSVMKRADEALYKAKENGRNQVAG